MNKLSILIALFVLSFSFKTEAQQGAATGTPAADYPLLMNKLKKSDKDIENVKKNVKTKLWLTRAEVLMDIFEVNLQHLGKGAQRMQVRLMFGEPKEKKEITRDGKLYEECIYENVTITFLNNAVDSYVETNKIHENPLPLALEALKKAQELDTDNKSTEKLKVAYTRLRSMFQRKGLEEYVAEDFKAAYLSFKTGVDINLMDLNKATIDTNMVFNTGMIAAKAELTEESIIYYEMAKDIGYPEPSLYIYLKNKYFAKGDTVKGAAVLTEGFEKHSGNQDIVIELINYYLNQDKADEALEYIHLAQKSDPENISLMFAEGTLYDKNGDIEKAVEIYAKTTQIDPEFFNGFYNLGVIRYNQAQQIYKAAGEIKDNKAYDAKLKEGDEVLKKVIEPMKKCLELGQEKESVLDVLKSVYYRLKMNEEYKEIKEMIEQL